MHRISNLMNLANYFSDSCRSKFFRVGISINVQRWDFINNQKEWQIKKYPWREMFIDPAYKLQSLFTRLSPITGRVQELPACFGLILCCYFQYRFYCSTERPLIFRGRTFKTFQPGWKNSTFTCKLRPDGFRASDFSMKTFAA